MRNYSDRRPQWLKPKNHLRIYGTTEVVPFRVCLSLFRLFVVQLPWSPSGSRGVCHNIRAQSRTNYGLPDASAMEILTPKSTRRSTRIRVEIPVSVTSLDRARPFADKCMVLIVSAQGCGFRSSRALQMETPIMISDLPGGGSVTARVANCLPLGSDGKYFLVGASLYTHGNFWGIADAPEDWNVPAQAASAPANGGAASGPMLAGNKNVWPYNVFPEGSKSSPKRK